MLNYHIVTGSIYENTEWLGNGYSGAGKTFAEGRNNPDMVSVVGKGPIPPGRYKIGEPYHHKDLGRLTFNLTPCEGTDTLDRDLFRIHGNNATNDASHGCIVAGPSIREAIELAWLNGERYIDVSVN